MTRDNKAIRLARAKVEFGKKIRIIKNRLFVTRKGELLKASFVKRKGELSRELSKAVVTKSRIVKLPQICQFQWEWDKRDEI